MPYLSSIYALKHDAIDNVLILLREKRQNMVLQPSSDLTIRCPYSMTRSQANENLAVQWHPAIPKCLSTSKANSSFRKKNVLVCLYNTSQILHPDLPAQLTQTWWIQNSTMNSFGIFSTTNSTHILAGLCLLTEKFHMNTLILKNTVSNAGTTWMLTGWSTSIIHIILQPHDHLFTTQVYQMRPPLLIESSYASLHLGCKIPGRKHKVLLYVIKFEMDFFMM